MSNKATTKNDILTLSESSAYTGVSTRTIERHATFTKYQPESITRNSRKTKGFSKSWLDKQFKDVGQMSDKPNDTENEAIKEVSLIDELKQDVTFLRKEIEAKNDQLQAKDNQIIELISSEQKTKMLLADLQLQQKNLLLDKPSAKQWEKKSNKIWWAFFFLLLSICGAVIYFGLSKLD